MLAELEQHGVSLKEVTEELVEEGVQQFADAFDKLFGTIARRRRTLLEGDRVRLEIGPGSPEMKTAFAAEMEVWRMDGRIRRLWAGDKSLWTGTDEDKWVGWLHVVEQELADIDRLHAFAEKVKQARVHRPRSSGDGRVEPGTGSAGRNLRTPVRLAAFPHAGQHRSRADQGDRAGGRSRQDAVHRLLQIRQHAGTQHFHGIFPRPRRRGARQGQGRRTLRRGDRSRFLAGATSQAAALCPCLPWRAVDRRPLLRAVEVRPGASGGDGS